MILLVERKWRKTDYTIGNLYVDGVLFSNTLEDPDRGLDSSMPLDEIKRIKVKGDTCIPYGTYRVSLDITSPKYSNTSKYPYTAACKGKMPRVMNVKGFEGILIHAGNTQRDTEGCLLVGENKAKGKVLNSQKTWQRLYALLKEAHDRGEEITITYER